MGLTLDYYKGITYDKIKGFTDEELKITLQNVALHVNSRTSQLRKSNVLPYSRAYASLMQKTGGNKLTSKGKSRGELIKEIKWGVQYLNSETGTVSGSRALRNKLVDMIDEHTDDPKEKEEIRNLLANPDFWELYRRIEEEVGKYYDSEDIIQGLYDELDDDWSASELANLGPENESLYNAIFSRFLENDEDKETELVKDWKRRHGR